MPRLGPRPQAPGPRPHSLRPPLEGGHCEQGHHGRKHVVKVEFVVRPLAGVQLYLRGVPILVLVVIAPGVRGETWSPLHAAMPPLHVLWVPGSECAGETKVPKRHHWALPSHRVTQSEALVGAPLLHRGARCPDPQPGGPPAPLTRPPAGHPWPAEHSAPALLLCHLGRVIAAEELPLHPGGGREGDTLSWKQD